MNDPMFDQLRHTQGGYPHLLEYLWGRYCKYLNEEIEARKEEGKPTVDYKEAVKKAPAINFLSWATEFMNENRVVENFFVDANHGIRLSNNQSVVVCPGTEIQGTMQSSAAVLITDGRRQHENEGVRNTNALKI